MDQIDMEYLKWYKCMKTNGYNYFEIGIVIWNHIIVRINHLYLIDYLELFYYLQIIWNTNNSLKLELFTN